ncbi:FecR domain-containing protein [Sphingomonas sp. HITSZ_GF]|uniref:FecR family protein n=1 Tax=Sphingomonas sp. HITSZ_GF TaxID=3037247 RepID=UPI00240DE575|nr:FecR domain-containing protein [Sphingomonas sp. HITSZ_GF]MDG2535244.1 FecR domain-containing protein [Sphingomonas sp. HITSZ_GF]
MTIPEGQAEEGDDALAREAAHWFARMRGPDADASRAEFEVWLAQGAAHRVAYNDAAEVFAMGKLLAEPGEPAPAPTRRRPVLAMALATVAACVVGGGAWVAMHPSGPAGDQHEAIAGTTEHRRISTIADEARVVRLADGSTVRLGDGTILDVDIGSGQRGLRLLQGQARFEVAHEQRPFIVFAGGGSVTARGTIFEVALTRSGKVDVRLVQGAVDVALPGAPTSPQPPIRKLAAGEGVSFAAQPDVPATPAAPAGATSAPSAAREFEATPVAELVALANHGAVRPIRLADASLAGQRVSGRFRVDDTELLARRLGALFNRSVDTSRAGEIVLAPAGAPIR